MLRCDFTGPNTPGKDSQMPTLCQVGTWGKQDISYQIVKDENGKPVQLIDIKNIQSGACQFFFSGLSVWMAKYYKVSFRLKSERFTGQVGAQIRRIGNPWNSYVSGIQFYPTSEWKTYTFSGKPGADYDNPSNLGVLIETGDMGRLWIGDVTVEEFATDPDAKEKVRTPVAGNLLPRSSFEADGDYFWSAGVYGQPDLYDGEWDDPQPYVADNGKFGQRCLAFPSAPRSGLAFLRSALVPVCPGREYELKFWARNGTPGATISAGIKGMQKDVGGKSFTLKPVWQEYKLTVKLPDGLQDVFLDFTTNKGNGIHYLDGLSFGLKEPGDGYRPAYPYELSAVTPKVRGNLYYWGEAIPLKLHCAPANGTVTGAKVGVTMKVTGYPDVAMLSKHFELIPNQDQAVELPAGRNGLQRIELIPDDPKAAAPAETLAARLPEPRKTGEESHFGTHLTIRPYFLDYAKRMGFKWLRCHDAFMPAKWCFAEPEPGRYVWFDQQIDEVKKRGFFLLGLPDYPPEWAKKAAPGNYVAPHMYEAFCAKVAAHYKGKIDDWEIWNEPYMDYFFHGTPAQYREVFIAGAKGIRQGNPQAKILGPCPEINDTAFVKALGPEVWPLISILSFHLYFTNITGNGPGGSFADILSALKTVIGKNAPAEAWDSEGAGPGAENSFYRFLKVDPCLNDKAVAFASRVWIESVRSGISKLFIYTIHQSDTVAYYGGFKMMIGFDRSVTPGAAATAICAWCIDGLKYRTLPDSPGVKEAWFVGKDRQVWTVYADQSSQTVKTLRLDAIPKNWLVLDAMGNDPRLDAQPEPEIGIKPFYVLAPPNDKTFTFKCKAALRNR